MVELNDTPETQEGRVPASSRYRVVIGGAQAQEELAELERLERGAAPYSAAILNERVEEPRPESLERGEAGDEAKMRKEHKRLRAAIPGFRLTFGITVAMLSIIVLIPLASVLGIGFLFVMLVLPLISVITKSLALGGGFYLEAIIAPNALSALRVTLIATIRAVLVNTFFGLIASWLLTKFRFRGQRVLATLIDIPFSIRPVIAGLAFVMTFGRTGWANPIIGTINDVLGTDISFVFSIPGVVLATILVTFPFVLRELLPIMHSQGSDEESAAALMGASGPRIFAEITFPKIKWALLYGVILCAARAFGEFGAVYALSKARGQTFTLPLEIDALYMNGTPDSITAAFAVSSLLVVLAVIILILRNVIEYRPGKKNAR